MKRIICIDIIDDPHLECLYDAIAKAVNESTKNLNFIPLSHDGFLKRITEGKLPVNEMADDMKISQSKFFHCYSDDMKEIIKQETATRIAVFAD